MSALGWKPDITDPHSDVRNVPKADIAVHIPEMRKPRAGAGLLRGGSGSRAMAPDATFTIRLSYLFYRRPYSF